jgi:hypothetical protein
MVGALTVETRGRVDRPRLGDPEWRDATPRLGSGKIRDTEGEAVWPAR